MKRSDYIVVDHALGKLCGTRANENNPGLGIKIGEIEIQHVFEAAVAVVFATRITPICRAGELLEGLAAIKAELRRRYAEPFADMEGEFHVARSIPRSEEIEKPRDQCPVLLPFTSTHFGLSAGRR